MTKMKNQNKTTKYKNKTKLTSNLDNKFDGILDRVLIKSKVDQLTAKNKIMEDTKLINNIEADDEIFDLTGNEKTELTQPKSNQSSVKRANTQDNHTIIEMVDSDLEITYSGNTKNDTSIIANTSLSDQRKKKKKKKQSHTVPEGLKKKRKDSSVKNYFNITDKEDNDLFFFDLSGNKINNSLTEMTCSSKSKNDTDIIKRIKKKKKKRKMKQSETDAAIIGKKKKKNRSMFNDSQLANKEDNELFFFDLSGSKTNSNLPQMIIQNNAKYTSDEDIKITHSRIDPKQNESKLVRKKNKKQLKEKELDKDDVSAIKKKNQIESEHLSHNQNSSLDLMGIIENETCKSNKYKQLKEKELDKDDASAIKKKNQIKSEHWSQLQNSSLDLIGLIEEETHKRNRDKITYSDNQFLLPSKKKKKKIKSEPTEVDGTYAGLDFFSTDFSDHKKQIPKEKKKKKKVKLEPEDENIKAELNFSSDLFSDYNSEIPMRTKRNKKVKSAAIQVEHMEQSIDFFKNIFTDYNKSIYSEKNNDDDDVTHLSNIAEKRKKKSKIKSKEITTNQNNEHIKLERKLEENQNEHGNVCQTFEDYFNMGQDEDYTFHISPHSVNEIGNTLDSSFKKKKNKKLPENLNHSQNKTETAVYKKERTISEESFNTLINSIVGEEENSYNASLNENTLHGKKEVKNEHKNYKSMDFNFDTLLDTLINDSEAKENKKEDSDNELFENTNHLEESTEDNAPLNNNSLKKSKKKKDKTFSQTKHNSDALINNEIEELHAIKKREGSQEHIEDLTEENNSISKKSKRQKDSLIDTNSCEVIDETEQELYIRKKKKKKKKKTGEVKQEQIEENEAYDTNLLLNEDLTLLQNGDCKPPKKSKKKKDKNCSLTQDNFDDLIDSQIEELYVKKKRKGNQERIEDLVEENQLNSAHILNRSQDSNSSFSKNSSKQKYFSAEPHHIEETEKLPVKKKKKAGDVKQELTEGSEAYDTHASLNEVLSLPQNSDCNALKKSKKKKDRTFYLTENSSDVLINNVKKIKSSQQSNKYSTEENQLNHVQDSESKIFKKSKKRKRDSVDSNLSNTIDKSRDLHVKNKRRKGDEKKQQSEELTEEIEAYDTHLSMNEVFSLLQNSDRSTPKRSKKKKTPHHSPIEEIESELQNFQDSMINNQNEAHLSPNDIDFSQNSTQKSKKKKSSHKSSIEDTDPGLQNSQETVINSQNEANFALNEVLNHDCNASKNPKKKKTQKPVSEETESGLLHSQETVINSPNKVHLSLNDVFNLLQNSDGTTAKKSKKKKTLHNFSIEENESGLRNSQETVINSQHEALNEVSQNNDGTTSKKSKKKKPQHSLSEETESEIRYKQETVINSPNEVLSISQNNGRDTPKKSSKKNSHKSSIEETESELRNSQETVIISQNEADLALNEVIYISQNNDIITPKKIKKEKTLHASIEETESGLLNDQETVINNQNEADLALKEVLNISKKNDDSTSKKSKKKKTQNYSSEENESELRYSQETVINSPNKVHLSLDESINLSQNSDDSIPKKSKKKKTLHNFSIEETESGLLNNQEIVINSQNEANVALNEVLYIDRNTPIKIKKENTLHNVSIEETESELLNSEETIINSQNEADVALNEVFYISQNNDGRTPIKIKKEEPLHNVSIEETESGLLNGQETVINSQNETDLALNEVLNISQNNDSNTPIKIKKEETLHNVSFEETESGLLNSQETVINSQNEALNEVINISQNNDRNTSKKSKKKKTQNSSSEETESGLRYSQETIINSPNEVLLSLNEVLNISQNIDSDTPKKSHKKKTSHESLIEETESILGNSQVTVINSQNKDHLNNDGNTPKKSDKKNTLYKSSIEETELGISEETIISSPNEVHLSLNDVLNLSLNSDSNISTESKKKTCEETIQENIRDIFASSEEESLENMKTFLENDYKRLSRERSIVSEETKQDSGYEDCDNIPKTKKKTVQQSNEDKQNYSNIETNQILNTDTSGEKTLKRKKCDDSDKEKHEITKKLKVDCVNDSVNIDDTAKSSKTDKLNVDDVFSDDDEEESSKKIQRRVFKNRRNSSYVSDRDDVIKLKNKRRTRSLSERDDSGSDSKLNVTGCDVTDLTEEELDVLRKLSVHLPFEDRIPPLHIIQRPSKPSAQDVANAKELNAKFGAFTKDEDAQIIKNWKRFLKIHDLDVRPFVFFKFRKQWNFIDKIKFLQFLAHKLSNRMPFRVHARFKKLFESKGLKKGRYSFEEDKKIIEFINKTSSSKPFYDLGLLLNRAPNLVEMRYSFLTSGENKMPIRWTTDMSERMVKAMMEVVKTENVKDLEHYIFKDAEWKKLSEMLDNISPKRLQRAWMVTVHSRLFMKGTKQDMKKQLLQMLIENGEDDFRAISWQNYANKFQGVTGRKLNDMFRTWLLKVPKELKTDLKSTLEYLVLHLDDYRYAPTQFRYRLKNGKLVCKKRKENRT